ncbi:MAG: undecaprenyl/decaprenyl-phosphate alpha-N-acetylglucosaminyl 1-phosphate transferase [Bacteroidetes bacterium]|nr:undecaprenyl/decaprenyl-phosphate alpha-N-acetylglucosaminyl 1-phosphate transferase [Bacteroidota bacterium]
MFQVASGAFIAYIVTFFTMPFIIRIARVNRIYDVPDARKTHADAISSLGGISIFVGLSLALLLVSDFKIDNQEFQYHLAAFFIIFIIGVIDDIFVLKAWKKVLGQMFVAAVISAKAHLLITNFHGFLGVNELTQTASYVITFFVIMLVINSFNLIDGVDGLAGSLGLFSCLGFGVFFLLNNYISYAILSLSMAGSLLAFLQFNFPPAKIFMGDSGSMLLGLVNAILVIKFSETASFTPVYAVKAAPAIGFGLLLIPLLDVLRVFIIRLSKGKSPFAPDRNHVHHLLLNKGFSSKQVTLILIFSSMVFAAVPILLNQVLDINFIVLILIGMFFSGVLFITYFLPIQKALRAIHTAPDANVKVLNMYSANKENTASNDE